MRKLIKYELYRYFKGRGIICSIVICFIMAIISHFVIAGRVLNASVFGMAFEFFIPHCLVAVLPAVYVAKEQKNGLMKTILYSGESRLKIFLSKVLIYNINTVFIILIYLLILTLFNIKGMYIQEIGSMNSFVYFMRCASLGISYCLMLASILFCISILFGSQIFTVGCAILLFIIELILRSALDFRITDKIIFSEMFAEIIINSDKNNMILCSCLLIIIIPYILSNFLSLICFIKKDYK